MNARTGQVVWKGCSKTGVPQICLWLKQLRAANENKRVVLVWDNWPVHYHPLVLGCASEQNIEILWLPTYAPWLNPIEKMWKWLVADVLSAHRHASEWEHLRWQVEQFLERLTKPSKELLRYCGLIPG